MIHVMVVDDLTLVRQGIARLLADKSDIKVTAEGASGEEALTLVKEKNFDVILMDVHMPGIGGLEASRRIAHSKPKTKLLILTVPEADLSPFQFLQLGALGYVTKNISVEELITAIHTVHKGQRYLSTDIAQSFALQQLKAFKKSPFEQLTSRELQVASLLAQGEKTHAIAERLCLGTKTVHTYRYRIFEKMDVNSDVKLTHKALAHGLIQLS
ncbi:MAG: response regulator [Gammaproteobacteria bacterium]|nr:response regulator [Gammaproteobacteria bacterium]